ncbi:MAG: PilX N-terminal domain-containing pilus assembly protein [Pseudomonadota bacterium]|nr:hypothetical protein [Pseudomonadales bacterium]MDY6921503.1 PilX N-terminal domain-containing pilus assembly protein [Pseudomonadota bacterium]
MKRESGSVLLISLVMLLILTLVGVASISGVSMTEKMTNSQRDYDIAFELAEAALVQGERWLDDYDPSWKHDHIDANCTGNLCWTQDCSTGLCFRGSYPSTANALCEVDSSGTPIWQVEANWENKALTYSESVPAVDQPKYMIEFLCYTPRDPANFTEPPDYTSWVRVYRVTALAYGTHPETRVMLQSTYRVE